MSTKNKPSPEQLGTFEGEWLDSAAHGASEECKHELSCKEQDRLHLRTLLMAGSMSVACGPVGGPYFEGLRQRVRKAR